VGDLKRIEKPVKKQLSPMSFFARIVELSLVELSWTNPRPTFRRRIIQRTAGRGPYRLAAAAVGAPHGRSIYLQSTEIEISI